MKQFLLEDIKAFTTHLFLQPTFDAFFLREAVFKTAATFSIDGAANAGILAAKMIAISEEKVYEKIVAYKDELKDGVVAKKEKIEKIGYKAYMEQM